MTTLSFLGDIMPGGLIHYKDKYISKDLLRHLNGSDLRVGTLESAIGDDIPFDKNKMNGKMNIIYSPNSDITRLKELNIDVVSLANNHIYDLGEEGLINTISQLDLLGIKHCGAGKNIEDASKPVVVRINNKTIAFLAYCQFNSVYIGHLQIATESQSGVNPLIIEKCITDIKEAKKKYDIVFILPHWGNEYQYLPTPDCVQWAKQMIDAGADGIFGSHTHQIQPLVKYRGKPIAYSLGNGLFPDFYMQPPRPIWYPDVKIDENKIKRFVGYPQIIQVPIIQEWRHLSRIGMIANYTFEATHKSSLTYRLTYLDLDNKLDFYANDRPIKLRMNWMKQLVSSANYNSLYHLYNSKFNLPRRGYHLLTRFFK